MDSLGFSFLDHGSATEAWPHKEMTLDRSATVLQPCVYVSACHDMTGHGEYNSGVLSISA
ncbi:hypothetical protein MUK42_13382 [Musa troglodytarum]|uniref:Uncharacterized protein n=1 Tax=Musa troglodytarum TaxID=320322 RepID=A0A9E7IIF9_9LILI|nr:hypothetical protein MUK42_13382 [Musa troglodytarum]